MFENSGAVFNGVRGFSLFNMCIILKDIFLNKCKAYLLTPHVLHKKYSI